MRNNNKPRHIGITVEPYKGITPSVALYLLKVLGISHAELDSKAIPYPIPRLGLHYSLHLPYYSMGWDISIKRARKRIEWLIKVVNILNYRYGVDEVVTHLPESKESDLDYMIYNIKRIKARVFLENPIGMSYTEAKKYFLAIKREVPNVGFLLDFPHASMMESNLFAIPDALMENLGYVHLSDSRKGVDEHMIFGKGELPIDKILQFLKKIKFSGTVTLELLPRSYQDLLGLLESYRRTLWFLDRERYSLLYGKQKLLGKFMLSFLSL